MPKTDHCPKYRTHISTKAIAQSFFDHLRFSIGKDKATANKQDVYKALALTVKDRLTANWIETQKSYHVNDKKRLYYLSMEFLPGRTLGNSLINLEMFDKTFKAMQQLGYDLEELRSMEWDAGLGNGGLGRLAACFLDSLASLSYPAIGYGIRYEYGIFFQHIKNGKQIETPDNWLRYGNPWEIARPEYLYPVRFNGHVEHFVDKNGNFKAVWKNTDYVMAMAFDTPIPGFRNKTVNTLRLWSAKSTRDFNLEYFNSGDYIGAVHDKNKSEAISKVLYPSDNTAAGKELRLKQEYFFVSATLQDVIRRFELKHNDYALFPKKAVIQLNDTHPALAVADLMRIFIDEKELAWAQAWNITNQVFAYTNHTILPEALEKWRVSLLDQVLPRHLEIIHEINSRFLEQVISIYPNDLEKLKRVSIVEEEPIKRVQMAKLAVISCQSVNGVSALHSNIVKENIFPDFADLTPDKFKNITNGVTPRRWLFLANRKLSDLITSKIGDSWLTNFKKIKEIAKFADDDDFCQKWLDVKQQNKSIFAKWVLDTTGIKIDPTSLFDFHVKRIHEYKRQLLNILHVIHFYNRIKKGENIVPRTVFFAGKAAPGYYMAKLVIQLICAVAKIVNKDPICKNKLKVVFLPNYSVSLAQKIFPAAELSEQISTAGSEASGTGNMKFAMNGALTIGTLDGANIEIFNEVGKDNMFIFGLNADDIMQLRKQGYNPWDYYHDNPDLSKVIDMIAEGIFNHDNYSLFNPITDSLLKSGDHWCVLADFDSYVNTQLKVEKAYGNKMEWAKKSIINVAGCAEFSSDRSIEDYNQKIWKLEKHTIQ